MTTQQIARLLLGTLMLITLIWGIKNHGKQIRQYTYHAAQPALAVAVEVILIWLAGGWG